MYIKIILLLSLTLGSINLLAKDNDFVVSFSSVGMNMDYKEYDRNGQLIDSEKSEYMNIAGVDMSLSYVFSKKREAFSSLELSLMVLGGETTYTGSYLESGEPYGSVISITQNTIVDTDITYKTSMFLSDDFRLLYGVGIGYYEWERTLSASQVEVYKWHYIKSRIGIDYKVYPKLDLGLCLEYQYGFNSEMTSSNPNIDFTLGGVNVWEISLPLTYKYSENTDLLFEMIFEKQTIEASNVVAGYYEPDSIAHNNYVKFGLIFKF